VRSEFSGYFKDLLLAALDAAEKMDHIDHQLLNLKVEDHHTVQPNM
jgi:hypothetical protein